MNDATLSTHPARASRGLAADAARLPLGPLLAAGAALLLLVGLGWTDVSAPDEPRYVQVAEELRSGIHGPAGFVLLHLNGEAYTQKPPLYYWAAALLGAPGGHVSEVAARLPSALSGLAAVGLTFLLGRLLLGRATGLLGAALLLTVYEFARLARRVQLDVMLTLFELGAVAAFVAVDRGWLRRRTGAFWFHAALGLGVLTKGPVGFLLPLLAVTVYLAWERRLADLRPLLPWWGWLLSVAPGLAWITAATWLAPSGFADEAVGSNLFGRFFAGTSHERPLLYYLYQFPLEFLPWTLLWPAVWWVGRRRVFTPAASEDGRRAWRLLLAVVATSVVFFSISSGKRGLYLFPVFPAAALLCADAMVRWLRGRRRMPPVVPWVAGAFAAALAAIAVEGVLAGSGATLVLDREWVEAVRADRLFAFGVSVLAVIAAAAVAWAGLGARGAPALARVGVGVAGALWIEACAFWLLYPAIDPITSPRPIAEAAASITAPDEPVGLVSDRALTGGLVYYGGRRIEPIEDEADLGAFLAAGGRAIVVKRRKLDRVEALTPVEVVASVRPGSREVVVVRSLEAEPMGGAAPVADPADPAAPDPARARGGP